MPEETRRNTGLVEHAPIAAGSGPEVPPSRQRPLDVRAMSGEQRRAFEEFSKTRKLRSDGYFGGPWDLFLLNPQILERMVLPGADVLWENTSLDRGLVELIICITASLWAADIEWWAHAPRAIEHGIPESVLGDILAKRRPAQATPEQHLAQEIVESLHFNRTLDEDCFRRGVNTFGERGLIEVLTISGFYVMVAMNLNAFQVQVPPGHASPFAERLNKKTG